MVAGGEIYWVDLGQPSGSEPGLRRPAVVVQSDRFSRSGLATCLVAALSTNVALATMPGNVMVLAELSGLPRNSVVNVTQLATVDKRALQEIAGSLPPYVMGEISSGLRLVLDL